MASARPSQQASHRATAAGAAPQPQGGFHGQPGANPQFPPQGAGYPQAGAGFPPVAGQPGAYPGYFPPMGYPPYGYGMMPPPQPPPEPTRRATHRSRRTVEEPEDEDEEDEDAETEYLDTDEESEPETVSSININDMYAKFKKFTHEEVKLDRKFGMRVQMREPIESPHEKKSCTCVPRPTGGKQAMVYESKRCFCGYGTEKMIRDLRKPVRMLWSPEEEPIVNEHVKNFKRVVPEKIMFPAIPGTAPGPRELKPKGKARLRALPGTSHGRPADPLVPKKRLLDNRVREKVRNLKPVKQEDQLIPDDEFEPVFKDHLLRSGKYFDPKLSGVVEYRVLDANNTVIGKKKEV